jgi:hypothetical protein
MEPHQVRPTEGRIPRTSGASQPSTLPGIRIAKHHTLEQLQGRVITSIPEASHNRWHAQRHRRTVGHTLVPQGHLVKSRSGRRLARPARTTPKPVEDRSSRMDDRYEQWGDSGRPRHAVEGRLHSRHGPRQKRVPQPYPRHQSIQLRTGWPVTPGSAKDNAGDMDSAQHLTRRRSEVLQRQTNLLGQRPRRRLQAEKGARDRQQ